MKKQVVWGGLLLAALVVPGGTAVAVEGESVAVMDEVVVTASKIEEKRSEIVNAVVIKDATDIAEAPAESLGSLLANEPGIDWRTQGNYGGAAEEIQLRGMGGDGTLLVMDGVVLNSPSLGAADVSQVPLNAIERVEVVKGPGSLLYGSGAMGGTVYVLSKHPKRDGYSAKVEAGYGTEGTYHLAAESGGFVAGDFGYYLSLNRKETDGYRDNSDLEHNDISLNLLYDRGEPLTVDFNFGYVDRKYGLPGTQPPEGTATYFSPVSGLPLFNSEAATLQDRGEDENRHSSLTLKGKAADWMDWRVKGDCAVLDSFNSSFGYNPMTYAYDGSSIDTEVTNTVRGLEGNLDLRPMEKIGLLVGSEYRNFNYENEQHNFDPLRAPTSDMTDEQHIFTQGTFAELTVHPLEQLRLSAGYRYETHSRFGHEYVDRIGAVVKATPDLVIKFSHGKHFKAPTMNDLYWPDDGFYTKGNPDLKPETGRQSDITVEESLFDHLVFASFSWFTWDIADKIAWAEDPSQPSPIPGYNYWVPSNINKYKTTGVEAGIKVGPVHSLVFDLAMTYLDAKEELSGGVEREARYTPGRLFKLGLTQYADFGLTTNLTTRYVSSRPGYYVMPTDRVPEITLESYWTVDLKLEQVLAEHWRLGLLVSNLFDEDYVTYLGQNAYDFSQQPYPGAGRSVFGSLGYEF